MHFVQQILQSLALAKKKKKKFRKEKIKGFSYQSSGLLLDRNITLYMMRITMLSIQF